MGKKIHPKIFRIQERQNWASKWFSRSNFPQLLKQDVAIRDFLKKHLRNAYLGKIEIERTVKAITLNLHSARPGTIIGRGGTGIEELKKKIKQEILKNNKVELKINIKEISQPSTDAHLLAQDIVFSIEKKVPFRRAVKRVISRAEQAGVKGIKVKVSGRLNGVEIARSERFVSGALPLGTIRADIDYAFEEAQTTYGKIGVKVWVYRGEIFSKEKKTQQFNKVNKK